MTPLDVGKDDIKALADDVLRELVAHLSTAQLRRDGQPVSGVRAGGRQEAKDGGIDVEVSGGVGSFLPRQVIGFQVKKDDYIPSRVAGEMCPKGQLRPSIQALAAQRGAYIIVSGAADISALARQERLDAMAKAAPGLPGLHLDYYDSDHLARWVNEFPSIAAWVRTKLGRPIQGWKAFDNWSRLDEGTDAPYLVADDIFLQPPKGDAVPVLAGIDLLRQALAAPRSVVRLVGLSGLGKTRLVQALFDARVGEGALDQLAVIYTDIGHHPQPGPQAMIAALALAGFELVVIVDNCPPDTHRILAKEHQCAGSRVSVLTVEYDVSDDTPEDTQVFRLQVGDEGVVPQLLERRRPDLPRESRVRIAEFAGGNTRLALALADTVETAQSLSKFTDDDLLKRLFQQRKGDDEILLRVAEACSLVYSFHNDPDIADAELPVLADLARVDVEEFFAGVVELQNRGLIQSRSDWRALLPHALALRLARPALEKIRPARLRQTFEAAPLRLRRSFTRRIEMLHDAPNAVAIAQHWLMDGGMLGNPALFERYFDMRVDMLRNLAPVAPEAALAALERAVQDAAFMGRENRHRVEWCRLLHKLAYDPALFHRAAKTLARFLAAESLGNTSNSVKDSFIHLFNFRFSGTHATIEQRLSLVGHLMSAGGRMADCGVLALDRLLHTRLDGFRQGQRFGAHPRDFGFELTNDDQVRHWYGAIIEAVVVLAAEFPDHRAAMGESLARNFAGLWRWSLVRDQIEQAMASLAGNGFWRQGWLAVRNALAREYKWQPRLPERDRLRALEARLRPASMADRARAWVLSADHGVLNIAIGRDWQKRESKVTARVRQLAAVLATEVETLPELLPEFCQGAVNRGGVFGEGLALTGEPAVLWPMIREALGSVEPVRRDFGIAFGFLAGIAKSNPPIGAEFLDNAVTDPVFGVIFPVMQALAGLDEVGLVRLRRAMDVDLATLSVWGRCIWWDDHCILPVADLVRLVGILRPKPEGELAVVGILHRRVDQQRKHGELPESLTALAQTVVGNWNYWSEQRAHWDYDLAELIKMVLTGLDGADAARSIVANLIAAIAEGRADFLYNEQLMPALLQVQPEAVLDVLLGAEEHVSCRILENRRTCRLDALPAETLLGWARVELDVRLPFLAGQIAVFDNHGQLRPLALGLFDEATDKLAILQQYGANDFYPRGGYSGELSAILASRSQGLEPLKSHPQPEVRAWVADVQANLADRVASMSANASRRDERFE